MRGPYLTFLCWSVICHLTAQESAGFSYEDFYKGRLRMRNNKRVDVDVLLCDSTYFIDVCTVNSDVCDSRRFAGRYSIDSSGHLIFRGDVPFKEKDFLIRQLIREPSEVERESGRIRVMELFFDARLVRSASIRPRNIRVKAYRAIRQHDEHMAFQSDAFHPNFFTAGYYEVYAAESHRDSMFQKLLHGSHPCSAKALPDHRNEFFHPDAHLFGVDSLVFDTVFVSKLLISNTGSWSNRSDTFCLQRQCKITLPANQRIMGFHEGVKLFAAPAYSSDILRYWQEVDVCREMQFLEFFRDRSGIAWIHVKLQATVFDNATKLMADREIDAWALQKAIVIR